MELNILRFIQSFSNGFLDKFFEVITMIGEPIVLTILFTAIYWCFNKKIGEYLMFTLFTSLVINGIVKNIFKFQRPIGEKGIRTLRAETATGYSFPSGHSQTSTTFFSSLSFKLKKSMFTIISFVLIFLIGFSRLYLGVHYPKDVIVGILLGVLISYLTYKLYSKISNMNAIYISTTIVSMFLLFFINSQDYIKIVALLLGFTISIIIEKRYINFNTNINYKQKIIRWLVGIIFVIAIVISLKFVFPSNNIFMFIRYSTLSFICVAGYPYIFNKLTSK